MSSSLVHTPVSNSLPPCFFSCRIVKIDFYLAPPIKDVDICYSQFRSSAIEKVPVIRIFGAAPSGQKTCLHVHGAFPYLFVPCVTPDPNEGYLQQLCGSIDHALQVSLGAGSKPAQHVFKAVLVKGIPFYGYHKSEELFIKLYLYNPMMIKRLSDLLLAGAVMNTSLQPHEAHIPFPLQFMIDHNLYGMNYIHLAAIKFRIVGEESPVVTTPPTSQSHTSPLSPQSPSPHLSLLYNPSQTHWNTHHIPSDMVLSTPRQSVCELEVDAIAADILNRHELSLVSGGYPGLIAIWEEERLRREATSIDVPLSPPPSPERRAPTTHKAEARFKGQFGQILRERLGRDSVEDDTSLSERDQLFNCTQSCDPDLHVPDQSEGSSEDKKAESVEVIVDTNAIEQSMELTQRLSANSIYKSTDVELLNLMLELCETPIAQTQGTQPPHLSQSLPSSQSVGQTLIKKMERSCSIASERSLFSSSPSASSPVSHAQELKPKDSVIPVEKLKSEDSQLADNATPYSVSPADNLDTKDSECVSDKVVLLDGRAIAPVHTVGIPSVELMLDSSLDVSMEDLVATNSEETLASTQENAEKTEQQATVEQGQMESKADVAMITTSNSKNYTVENVSQSQNSSEQARLDENNDFISDLDLVIPSSRLSSPLPLSPETKELQDLVAVSFEAHQSSQEEISRVSSVDFESDGEDIPCGQVAHTQPLVSSQDVIGLSDVDPNWNPSLDNSFSSQSSLKSKSGSNSSMESRHGVQLEYDMPEIELVHSRPSEDSVLYNISIQSQRRPSTLSQTQSKQLSTSALRNQLLKMCSQQGVSPFDCEVSDGADLLEDTDSEEESFWMSQRVWEDIYQQAESSPSQVHLLEDGSNKSPENFIPQLDGRSDSPKKRRKTLGVRRKQPKKKESDQVSEQKSLTAHNVMSKDSASGVQEVKLKERTSSDHESFTPKKKSRPSLSLKKGRDAAPNHSSPLVEDSTSTQLEKLAMANNFSLKLEKVHIPQVPSAGLMKEDSFSRKKHRRKRSRSIECGRVDLVIGEKPGRDGGKQYNTRSSKKVGRERRKQYPTRSASKGRKVVDYVGTLPFKKKLKLTKELSLKSSSSEGGSAPHLTVDHEDSVASPEFLSPNGDNSSLDLNRTIIEESPDHESQPEKEDDTHGATETKGAKSDEHSFDDLDTSFCSIPESPPFTSSPVQQYDFNLTLDKDTSTALGSPVHKSSQDELADDKSIEQPTSNESEVAFPAVHLSSPAGREDFRMDSSVLSQSSTDTGNVSTDDFHLAFTSESEAELVSSQEQNMEQSLETSTGHDRIRTRVTLTRDKRTGSEVDTEIEKRSVAAVEEEHVPEEVQKTFPHDSLTVLDSSTFFKHPSTSLVSQDRGKAVLVTPAMTPPTSSSLMASLSSYNLPSGRHVQPFYSDPEDVQQPKDIGGRILSVPSRMPYDLKMFHPPYLRDDTMDSISFSVTGIQQMRTVLSMLSSTHQRMPPLCSTPAKSINRQYTVDEYKRDIKLRSSYLPHGKVVITPSRPPPSAVKIKSMFHNKKNKVDNNKVEVPTALDVSMDFAPNSTLSASTPGSQPNARPDSGDDSVTAFQGSNCVHSSTPMVAVQQREDMMESVDNAREEMASTPSRNGGEGKKSRQLPFTPILTGKRETSILEGPTPNNMYGFKVSQSALPARVDSHQVQHLTCMSLEVHVKTRGSLHPDPDMDPILALFYFIHNDWTSHDQSHDNTRLGIIAVDVLDQTSSPVKPSVGDLLPRSTCLDDCGLSNEAEVTYVSSELELLEKLVLVTREADPDIIIGYEVTMLSWGYCIDRAAHLNMNLTSQLSRMPNAPGVKHQSHSEANPWLGNASTVQLIGRITLNVWRLMRHEVALNVYSYENVAYHVLHRRTPLFPFKTLTFWYSHQTKLYRYRVIEYYLERCQGNFQLLDSFNLIGRTSEFARLYGIEFENVLDRGSQYRVESMMLRLAKPANYIAVSPSVQQRARMAAPECIPLILEPESKFYADPVLVLDFQSLYPSMVIAYNYCFSTCLGRVQNLSQYGDFTFGATSLNAPNHLLKKLKDDIHISPNGVVFVKSHIRHGIMPKMLKDILGTRIMVKSSMKQHKANKALNRMLDARQMGLKLIANVTYGYTAANFSGRMPCVEIADSIVRKGRETLERAIELVQSTPEWGGRVVYGDTDSLFVLLKGASKEEAFRIGKEITERVTANNPTPVKLKFEKVYLPCILQTKKRYVGYMYESLDQSEPVFDAKGIETVRRDGCPAVAKVLEKSLRTLFSTRDLSLVKRYVQRQCGKLLEGRGNLQEYIFAKEYRGREYYRPGACVPALELAKVTIWSQRRRS